MDMGHFTLAIICNLRDDEITFLFLFVVILQSKLNLKLKYIEITYNYVILIQTFFNVTNVVFIAHNNIPWHTIRNYFINIVPLIYYFGRYTIRHSMVYIKNILTENVWKRLDSKRYLIYMWPEISFWWKNPKILITDFHICEKSAYFYNNAREIYFFQIIISFEFI